MKKIKEKRSSATKIEKLSFNKKLRLFLMIFLSVILLAATYFLYITIKNKYVDKRYNAYTYSHNAKINYDVSLLPNNLYTQNKLGEGEIYVTDLIASINPKMKYEFSGDQPAKIKGKYGVTAVFEGFIKNGKEDKTLWQRKMVVQPEKSFSVNDKKVLLTSGCNLSLKSYNEMVENTTDLYKINCTANLKIIWKVVVDAKTGSGPINETIESTMQIPINEKYFEVGGNLISEKNGQIELTRKVLSPYYNGKITATCIAGVICLFLLIFVIFFTTALPEIGALEKKARQIFKNHADRLVGITGDILTDYEKKVDIVAIEDLVRIADDLGRSILYRINEKIEEIVCYMVLDHGTIYILDIRKSLSNMPCKDAVQTSYIETEMEFADETSLASPP